MISQMQPSNLQGSAATVKQNNAASLQLNSMSGLSTKQQNMSNTIQPSNNVEAGQGNFMNSLQQVPLSSLQQNSVSTPQQTNINSLSSQGSTMLQLSRQPTLSTYQLVSTMLQPQQKHQMLQNQQYKPQHQQLEQLMLRQQILQQQQQIHQLSRQLQCITSGQNSAYSHQQLKQMNPFQGASPQLFQSVSPQIPQHSSPQVDQQTHQQSLAKGAIPMQYSNSPFVLVDSEKPVPGVSSSSAANVGQHTGGAAAPAQSLAVSTHGISTSPLLAEFSGFDDADSNAFTRRLRMSR